MDLSEALERIQAIRAQVARTEVFRGYKAATVGCTGLLAFLAAGLQPLVVAEPAENVLLYLQLWISVAAICVLGIALELSLRWLYAESTWQREQTRQALEQFVPCLIAGAGMTWALVRFSPSAAPLLPGLWAILFGLGVFASCRQLPAPAVLVGVYYVVAGVVCLALARGPLAFHPWAMAGTFGVGQTLTAGVLYLTLERRDAER